LKNSKRNNALAKTVSRCAILGFASLLFFAFNTASTQVTPTRAYQVKAAFLYNFSQFVEWPPASLNSPNSPFVIGILGPDPFGSYIDELVAGEKMEGHPIVVQRYADIKELKNCHILYINLPNPGNIVASLDSRSVLTVSDANFTRAGGMIRFFTEKNKIKLEINPAAAKAARLNISSKLLRVAQTVGK
jgi:hypothetical protein